MSIETYRPHSDRAKREESQRKEYARSDDRKSAYAFYNQKRWRRCSKMHLRSNPLCVECERHGLLTIADHVDHAEPISTRPDLAFDPSNWQSLCRSCHSRKSMRERIGLTTNATNVT